MDIKPIFEEKFKKVGESSLNSNPKHFKIGYKTYRNIDPKMIIELLCNCSKKKLLNLQHEMEKIKNSDTMYFSDIIELETKNDINIFQIKGEYWTIGNLISRYCYIEFPDIKFICSAIIHPSIETALIKINHTESPKIIISAIKKIIKDIEKLHSAFK